MESQSLCTGCVRILCSLLLPLFACSDVALAEETSLTLGYAEGMPGEENISINVSARHSDPIHGFSLAISYPADVLQFLGFSRRGTSIEIVGADFFQQQVDNEKGEAVLGVVFSLTEPVTLRELPPTEPEERPQILTWLVFNILPEAKPGEYDLRLLAGLSDPPVSNSFSHRGTTVSPELHDGAVLVQSDNILTVESRMTTPGTRASYYVYARHPQPLQGYQVAVTYDHRALLVESAGILNTDALELLGGHSRVEFVDVSQDETFSPTHTRVVVAVVFDILAPFDDTQILIPETSSDTAQSIVSYLISVNSDADQFGSSFDLTLSEVDDAEIVNNAFIIDGETVDPQLHDGRIFFSTGTLEGRVIDYTSREPIGEVDVAVDPSLQVVTTDPDGTYQLDNVPPGTYTIRASKVGYFPNRLEPVTLDGDGMFVQATDVELIPRPKPEGGFRRGFLNEDDRVDATDVVMILGFLFVTETRLSCMKAADIDDNGAVDVSDPVILLRHLFLGGKPVAHPFVDCDVDLTPDPLDCVSSPVCQ